MKNLILTTAVFFAFGYASAQVDPKSPQEMDSIQQGSKIETQTLQKTTKKTDVKNMDAVKPRDHQKITRKNKSVKKDTISTSTTTKKKVTK